MSKNYYSILTTSFFLIMALFAIVFAPERFQADGAYYLFKVVNFEHFQIEHQRYILAVSQILPLVGVKIGLSLNSIFVLNSLNNVVFFYLIFLYAVYYLKDKTAGIAIILFMVFGVLHIQFTPMYEIWYGIILIVLVHTHLIQKRYFLVNDLFFLGIIFITILFSHPLLFIPLIFIILIDVVEKRTVHWKLFLLLTLAFVLWGIVKKFTLSTYETGKISMLDISWNKAYKDLLDPFYYWQLTKFFITYYTIPLVFFILTVVFYIKRRLRIKAWLLILFFFGHVFLINFTHVMDWALTPYFERMYMPLIPIVFLPFLYDVFVFYSTKNNLSALMLLFLVLWRIGRFVDVGLAYKQRTAQSERAILEAQKLAGSKFELAPSDYKWCMNYVDWSFTMESMLRSAAIDKTRTVTICTWEDFIENNNQGRLNNNSFMMRRWELLLDDNVNSKYFKINHGEYVRLKNVCPN